MNSTKARMHPSVLSTICNINAIAESASSPGWQDRYSVDELDMVRTALLEAAEAFNWRTRFADYRHGFPINGRRA